MDVPFSPIFLYDQMRDESDAMVGNAKDALKAKEQEAAEAERVLSKKRKVAEEKTKKAKANAESLEKEVRGLEAKIFEAGGQELQNHVKKCIVFFVS